MDRRVLRLIKLWLKAPIEERDEGNGTWRIGGGKSNARGTPQGGVVSPMLANIYMNWFLKYWRLTGRGEVFRAHVVAYADDFVILSRGRAAEALAGFGVALAIASVILAFLVVFSGRLVLAPARLYWEQHVRADALREELKIVIGAPNEGPNWPIRELFFYLEPEALDRPHDNLW